MDDKEFRKHLKDMVHGKHNVAEHDWEKPGPEKSPAKKRTATKRRAK